MRVFITGASGFIGRRLVRELLRRGDTVLALTRKSQNLRGAAGSERLIVVEGDPARPGPWQDQVAGCDAVITLAGEPILGQRWTAEFKRRLVSSRVDGMRRMVEALAAAPADKRPRTLIGASAIGYYGSRGDEILDENARPSSDFVAQLCVDWEAGAQAAAPLGLRVVHLRIGIVLGEGGGALDKMVTAFKAFVGGPLGSGEQYVGWIHLDDLVGLILRSLDDDRVSGPLNLTAPTPVTMRELARTIGEVLHRPSLMHVPEFALKVMLGEGSYVPLASQRVVPRRAEAIGYAFRFPDLRAALRDLLANR